MSDGPRPLPKESPVIVRLSIIVGFLLLLLVIVAAGKIWNVFLKIPGWLSALKIQKIDCAGILWNSGSGENLFSDDAPGASPRRCGASVAIVLYYLDEDFR